MKLRIDPDTCTGHGRCYALEGSLFTDDEAGYGQVLGDGTVESADDVAAAERAVRNCPERAITLAE